MADWNVGGLGDEEVVAVRAVLVGAGEVEAEAAAVSGSLEEMGVAAESAGRKMEGASRRSFLMGQAMFTLRRFVYQGTLALVAAGGAAVYFGLQFDSSMQQSTVALTQFLGGSKAAKAELASLYHLAAYTPFSFSDVTSAAKSMLSFGFSVKDTNYNLKVMADTMSGLGETGTQVQQFTNDIVKMAARGKLMGQDIRELVSLHIPALAILQKQLGLTATQIQNIGQAGIPASTAIPALFRGLEEQYGGMAAKQQRTLQGRLSTLKDLTQEMLGIAMRPLFTWLQDTALPVVNVIIGALAKGFGEGGFLGSLRELNRSNAPFWFKLLYTTIVRTTETIKTLYTALHPFMGLLLLIAGGALYILNTAMGVFNRHSTIMIWLIRLLVLRYIALNVQLWIATVRSVYLLATTWAYVTALGLYEAGIYGVIVAMYAWDVVTNLLAASMFILDAAMDANPVGLIILAIIALIAILAVLYWKSATFRAIVDAWLQSWVNAFNTIKDIVMWIIDHAENLKNKVEGLPGFGIAKDIVEYSPFVLPVRGALAVADAVAGSSSSTAKTRGNRPSSVSTDGLIVHTHVHLDRKQIAEAVHKYDQDKEARR